MPWYNEFFFRHFCCFVADIKKKSSASLGLPDNFTYMYIYGDQFDNKISVRNRYYMGLTVPTLRNGGLNKPNNDTVLMRQR